MVFLMWCVCCVCLLSLWVVWWPYKAPGVKPSLFAEQAACLRHTFQASSNTTCQFHVAVNARPKTSQIINQVNKPYIHLASNS